MDDDVSPAKSRRGRAGARKLPNLAEQLRAVADAAARRRQAEPGTPDHAAALRDMVRIQGELKRDSPQSRSDADDERGAVSTPPPWRTPEY